MTSRISVGSLLNNGAWMLGSWHLVWDSVESLDLVLGRGAGSASEVGEVSFIVDWMLGSTTCEITLLPRVGVFSHNHIFNTKCHVTSK